jgi:prepilin-type processing-associated H-X9-DG protein
MKARILPALEQAAMFNSINWTFNPEATKGQNDTILVARINTFVCPSDGNEPGSNWTFKNGAGTFTTAPASYPNNIGTMRNNNGGYFDGPAYRLNFPSGGPTITLAAITDGLSNTAIFSEWIKGRNETTRPGQHQIYNGKTNFPAIGNTSLANLLNSCVGATQIVNGTKGEIWLNEYCGQGGCYSHIMTPNLRSCYFPDQGKQPGNGMIGAQSNHPGGVNVGMLDGSARFIKDSVARQTWWAIATYGGGEVIDAASL